VTAHGEAGNGGLLRLRLDLGYDGGRFSGWARQPGRRTVQAVVEHAVGVVLRLGGPAGLTVAGRTDAGVHARRQVAHTDVPAAAWRHAGQRLPTGVSASDAVVRRLAGVLPEDVRVFTVAPAAAGFDARFSALSRRYAYRVADNPVGLDPLRRHDVLWYKRPLDLDAMNRAASALLGEHDFAAYCRSREGATTVRRLIGLLWRRAESGLAVATVEADAFCHTMVRALVGALLAVGDGRRPTDWPGLVLGAAVRDPAVAVVPPHGLTLEEVRYPDSPEELAARAAESRQFRA
jgi:tRNA pseudouridine38-40 synthase